jgi:hypothetical protein
LLVLNLAIEMMPVLGKRPPQALVGKTCDARSQLGNGGSIAVVSAPAMGVLADLLEERNLILKLLGRAS